MPELFVHFPICLQHISQERHLAAEVKYTQQVELLIEEFNHRLIISIEEKLHSKIIETHF